MKLAVDPIRDRVRLPKFSAKRTERLRRERASTSRGGYVPVLPIAWLRALRFESMSIVQAPPITALLHDRKLLHAKVLDMHAFTAVIFSPIWIRAR
jgi:hypothetical protein